MSLNQILIKSASWTKNADVSKMKVHKCSMGGFLKVLMLVYLSTMFDGYWTCPSEFREVVIMNKILVFYIKTSFTF